MWRKARDTVILLMLLISPTFQVLTVISNPIPVYDNKNNSPNQKNKIHLARRSSGIIFEDFIDFSEGYLDHLTLTNYGYIDLDYNSSTVADTWTWMNSIMEPSGRSGHSMVYDSTAGKGILFGGWTSGGLDFETWTYDLPTDAWFPMNPSTHPSARSDHSMVYDSTTGRVILFGGMTNVISRGFDSETWIYDLTTNNWTQMNPSTHPSGRYGHSMVYDSNSAKIILFGGYNSTGLSSETWIYDLLTNNWTQMNPSTQPNGRNGHSMVYDSTAGKVILFGGYVYDDTWIYDLATNNWTEMNPSTHPNFRSGHSMVYDTNSTKVVLFGGGGGFSVRSDIWVYDNTANSWNQMNPLTNPIGRSGHSMVYDSTAGKIILFGGVYFDCFQDIIFGDTIIYPGYHYYPNGSFESKLTSFGGIYNITGNFTWNPLYLPEGTVKKFQIGLSNTTRHEEFRYTDYYTSYFTFRGVARYLKYRVIFESDMDHYFSPYLREVIIYYSLEEVSVHITSQNSFSTVSSSVVANVSSSESSVTSVIPKDSNSVVTDVSSSESSVSTYPGLLGIIFTLSACMFFIRKNKND